MTDGALRTTTPPPRRDTGASTGTDAAAGSPSPTDATSPADGSTDSRLLIAVALLSLGFVALYLFVALQRVGHPFELEWMEGGVLGHVDRVRGGHPLYVQPSLAFVPYLYTPLYYVVAAIATLVLGDTFLPLRLVSFASSLALFGAIASLTRRDSRDRWTPVLAVGLFAACFSISGAWLDLAREDTLCLALLVAGLAVARRLLDMRADGVSSRAALRRAATAALLLALACLTKQVALLPAFAVVGFLALRAGRRTTLTFAGILVGILGVVTAVLQATSHGWFLRYVLVLPSRHEIVHDQLTGFFTHDLLGAMPFVVAFAVVGLWSCWRTDRDAFWFHGVVGGAMIVAAWLARLHSGGYDNVLLPAYAELAVLGALGVQRLLAGSRRLPQIAVAVLCVGQLALLLYDPRPFVPTAASRVAGDQVLAELRDLPRPVYLPGHPSYAADTGSPPSVQSAALEDVLRAPGDGTDRALAQELADAVAEHRFGAIVVDSAWGLSYLPDDLCRFYRPDHELLAKDDSRLEPVTGTKTRPDVVWLPRADDSGRDCSQGGGSPGDRP